ncbi:MAG TPA: glycosyltransferase [Planctomycetaceae bacterium]|nr:glycosyltransferase [Planctomycetaceae bacterium]
MTKKKTIRVLFADFWGNFQPDDNFFYELLSRRYTVEISSRPDCVIFSCFKGGFRPFQPYRHKYWRYRNTLKIFYTGENLRPPEDCDYAFTFDFPETKKNFRLPYYVLHNDKLIDRLILDDSRDIDAIVAGKTRFCNFVYSNLRAPERIRFFEKLSKYKKVDSGGRVLNNIGGPVADKMDFIGRYKFTIAFENSSWPGYTTEKIVEPMLAASIPIYWGNPKVNLDFNTGSFINRFDYGNDEALIERIIEIDENEDLYRHYLLQPYLEGNVPNIYMDKERILQKFVEIFEEHGIAKDS